jgi:NADH-quinone oxidoreductase subunit L
VDARDVLDLIWVIPTLPALGAVVLLLFGKRIGEPASGWLATGLLGLSFLASLGAFGALQSLPGEERVHEYVWFSWFAGTGGFRVDFGFLADPLSITMILFVTGIATLIHLYAIGYMHGDPRFARFFAYLNLFVASMLVLVLGSSFLVTFMGWEGVGLCSYLLISFWFERNSAAVAGKKAFVTNRVGDFGFMLAMFLIFSELGSLDYTTTLAAAPGLPRGTVTAIALLLFLGAMGKSAQVPLHIWLPDAMEGPTPVSALIHAATMVTAGVFLVCRAHVFFDLGGAANDVVAWIGAITALGAATVAIRQNDIKRVLAYSTLSQLGYMFLAAGVGSYGAAIFHMVTHAFFKALLFLAAGSVIHGMHHEQDMRRMGALRKLMPITAATFIVGWLSIAGVPGLSGFWSKDEILAKAWFSDITGNKVLWLVGIVTALLTAFYMTRQVWLVFLGNARWDAVLPAEGDHGEKLDDVATHHQGHVTEPHESPFTMTFPLLVLCGLSIVGGFLSLPFTDPNLEFLGHWLDPSLEGAGHIEASSFLAGLGLSLVAIAVGLAGIAIGRAMYRRGLPDDLVDPMEPRLGRFAKVLERAWFVDATVARAVSGPVTWFANLLADGVDRKVIDGAVNGTGRAFRELGDGLRQLQTGRVRNYALAIMLGAVALLGWFATRVAWS